ncbi:MAG: ABC transporter ATP-binding protein [Planctomycetota bacterium]|nr:ABC transporter ATP-binding protein [Planctomycetota bacterium]
MAVQNPLTLGTVVMFVMYLERFFMPIKILSDQLNLMQKAFAAGERVFEIMSMESDVKDPPSPVAWNSFESEITFENVSFAYKENGVLKDVSLSIPSGESWAIVGTDRQRQDHDNLAALALLRPSEGPDSR